jgi:RNA polymerase sigma-70 factor (ECF subfamily)
MVQMQGSIDDASRRASVDLAAAPFATGAQAHEDWAEIVERMLRGDRPAHLKLARFLTGLLARWHAFDFRDDWADLVQDVLLVVVRAAREGRVEHRAAWIGYLRVTTHHKLMDRLRMHIRHAEDASDSADEASEACWEVLRSEPRQESLVDVRSALARLPERTRRAVYAVYGEGLTYDEIAQETRTPRGTVRRQLREGMAALRRDFSAPPGSR